MSAKLHILGVRHHGPGSARSLLKALAARQPDILLIEGPADATHMLPWLGHEDTHAPVALVTYLPDTPKRAAYFPLAEFSPEFQAIRFGLSSDLPVRFFDLPQGHMLASKAKVAMPDADPMQRLAQAAGHKHYERWWNVLIEQRHGADDVFEGVQEMMVALREDEAAGRAELTKPEKDVPSATLPPIATLPPPTPEAEAQKAAVIAAGRRLADQREAYMRQSIRKVRDEGFTSIAIVCGAYHGPGLVDIDEAFSAHADAELLAGLPYADIEASWVPWSYSRMSASRGYGAGIVSPGWYHHLWEEGQRGSSPSDMSIRWLTKVATLLRKEGLSASSAHVIETVRLSESLAAMRELPFPGLQELGEATQTVMCFGDAAPLALIQQQLIVGERMGAVPPDTPVVPLQRDLHKQQLELRLRPSPEKSTLTLDLRVEAHLARSVLLHRLRLLGIPWGEPVPTRSGNGTYKELWTLEWKPEYAIRVIEANLWGNTVLDAATAVAEDTATKADTLAALTALLDKIILAELTETISHLMSRIRDEAALSGDIPHLMEAVPPLARISRYGSVRAPDKTMIREVVDGLILRICVGLPAAVASMNDDAAADMFDRMSGVDSVVNTLRDDDQVAAWRDALTQVADKAGVHGLVAGRACRLLLDARVFYF